MLLQFGAEKRTLIQTESVTLPSIHQVVLVDHKSATEKTSRPHRGWSCTETVPLCTDARRRRQLTFAPPLHYTQADDSSLDCPFNFVWRWVLEGFFALQHVSNGVLHSLFALSCVVMRGRLGVPVSP